MKRRNFVVPSLIIFSILVVIIFIFTNVKQPYIECSKIINKDLNINIKENVAIYFNNDKISKINFNRRIILPNKYIDKKDYVKEVLSESYDYLDSDSYNITFGDNDVLVTGEIKDDETIILNNINFKDNGGLDMFINPNTKDENVITLSINDKYSEGEFITKMKNNGYTCK